MKSRRSTPSVVLGAILAGAVPTASATAEGPEQLMTQGKLAADLGDRPAAEQAFAKLAAAAAIPETARAEALVRLGVVRRALGKTEASTAAFRKAMQSPGRDAEVTRLLALAVAGVVPDHTRWVSQWPKVRLVTRPGSDAHPSIQWPGPGPQGVRDAFPWRDPVTLDLENVPLTPLLHHLLMTSRPQPGGWTWPGPRTSVGFEKWPESYQPPAAVDGLEFVIHAAVQGHAIKVDPYADPRVTLQVSGMPWNELFENVLASNGLGFVLKDNLLFIARVEDLGAIERLRGGAYPGWPVDFHFLTANLLPGQMVTGDPHDRQTWKLGTDIGILNHMRDDIWPGLQFVPDADVNGTVTLRIRQRSNMQVLDLFLIANDLAAARTDSPDAKPGETVLRIGKLADLRGEAVDLSKLEPTPSPSP